MTLCKILYDGDILSGMIGQIAVLSECCHKVHGSTRVTYREAHHRIEIGDMPQMGLRYEEATVALPRQLHRRRNITGFQLHVGDKSRFSAQSIHGISRALAGDLHDKRFIFQYMQVYPRIFTAVPDKAAMGQGMIGRHDQKHFLMLDHLIVNIRTFDGQIEKGQVCLAI